MEIIKIQTTLLYNGSGKKPVSIYNMKDELIVGTDLTHQWDEVFHGRTKVYAEAEVNGEDVNIIRILSDEECSKYGLK